MIKIYNLRFSKPKYKWEFKVDRSSPLGNPYNMIREIDRDIVCDKYKEWFYNNDHSEDFYAYLKTLTDSYKKYNKLYLFCWCYPLRCHAETIKEYLENAERIT